MFDVTEDGRPRNWTKTISIITVVSVVNIVIFVVIRYLLDAENEFDEPLIQGENREVLTQFLGFFALTFCFGCWCCFCCGGLLLKYVWSCHCSCLDFGSFRDKGVFQRIGKEIRSFNPTKFNITKNSKVKDLPIIDGTKLELGLKKVTIQDEKQ
uniref:Transmembrane protein n=1 Tax=Rhabditophanes sp. KR3021 TaxID=114890 RepID=A0AC35UG14_9BILA